jgi:long-chain acyl-CoA synthetase
MNNKYMKVGKKFPPDKYFDIYNITDLKDMLYKTALKNKNRYAFKLKDTNGKIYFVTYEHFKNDVESLGTKLIQLGFKGKAISVIGKNSYNWAVSYLAASIIGIVVPIDKELHALDVINFLNTSKTSIVIGDLKFLKNIYDNMNKVKNKDLMFIDMDNSDEFTSFSSIINEGAKLVQQGNRSFNNLRIHPDDLHILLFTSGTTSTSKAVSLSHKNICSNIMSTASVVKVDKSVSVLSILPLHHTYECTLGYLLILYGGGTIAYCEGLRHISKNIKEFRPSFILSVPLLLENMHKKIIEQLKSSLPKKYQKEGTNIIDNLPLFMKSIVKHKIKKSLGGRLTTFIVGAAAMNPDIVESYVKLGFIVLQGYGLTECSPLVAGNNNFSYKADSCGLPIPNVKYKISNPNEEGIGEIMVKGPNVMLGYYNNEEETKKVIKNGWFYTGDLGYIDDNQFLYITGRCKTVIVTKNGKNIYPEEIEYLLNENPLISETMIMGIQEENDDETYVKAQIFPNIDAIKEYLNKANITKEELTSIISNIIQTINSKLPNYKHIKRFIIRDNEFEKTTTKKIKRFGANVDNKS